jgi:hypothetical protein
MKKMFFAVALLAMTSAASAASASVEDGLEIQKFKDLAQAACAYISGPVGPDVGELLGHATSMNLRAKDKMRRGDKGDDDLLRADVFYGISDGFNGPNRELTVKLAFRGRNTFRLSCQHGNVPGEFYFK